MPPDSLPSRAAFAALCVAFATLAASPGSGAPKSRERDARLPAPALAPLDRPAPPLPQLDVEIPAGAEQLTHGATADKEQPVSGYANYSAPRKKDKLPKPYPQRRVYAPRPFSPKNPLPPLEPYRKSPQAKALLKLRGTTTAEPPPPIPPPVTVAALPTLPPKPKPRLEQKPFEPLGIGVGSMRFSPFVEFSGGYDDNPNRLAPGTVGKRGSSVVRSDGGFALRSDWSRHSLVAELRMGYAAYPEYSAANRPDGGGLLVARYDVTRDTQIDYKMTFSMDTIRPGAPGLSTGETDVYVVNRPIVIGATAQPGVTHRFGRLLVSLRAAYERVNYENGINNNGTILNLAATSYNGFGGGGRIAYEMTPDLQPFVEGDFERRLHDSPVDFNGYYRDSVGFAVRGGAVVKFSELLRGEAGAGWGERNYVDPRLTTLRGPIIDAALIYAPSALTTVTLRANTTLNETTLSGASGVLTQSYSLQLSHDLLRNLNVSLLGSHFINDYQGADVFERGYAAGVKIDYKITRAISLRGSFFHEVLDTSFPNADYIANTLLVGLRFQL
ncbi:MAG: outer membrane beta-barrel protein [Methylocystis sp.]|uniref:outer membrane beta-barrel protein n=1 Tax=Methylocystis sp. TaxID=1911079 RepID=UPI003D105175